LPIVVHVQDLIFFGSRAAASMTFTWCGGVARQFHKITVTTDQAGSGIYTK